jgi:uncharacterized membrane protein YjfL (UPF0719 family)
MQQIISTLTYAIVGLVVFMVSIAIMELITTFSIRKKVVNEGNIALAIVLASIIASLGMIISSAIQ